MVTAIGVGTVVTGAGIAAIGAGAAITGTAAIGEPDRHIFRVVRSAASRLI
jgi:hypothetical protein